ncbi:hypothetical protein SeLEV6574_g04688 [Synchytrium endobioticum]|uniref:PH domain-containing protein n=1 Tax=Synchytrium endobioticum TaxID=286115 RepID=A0A507CYM1_9FUNG|nr:hypothetical protein SeLEV6574_g04688 [Synchytrium endobioticum]
MIDIPLLHIEEAYDDSPAFRRKLNNAEAALATLDSNIKKVVGVALQLDYIAKEYSEKNELLADSLQQLCALKESATGDASLVSKEVIRMTTALKSIEEGRKMALGQIKDLFLDPMTKFSTEHIAPVKKYGDEYRKATASFESAHSRYATIPPKGPGLEKAAKDVEDARKEVHRKAVEYCYRLNDVDLRRKFEIVESITALMFNQTSFYHQSHEHMADVEPTMRIITGHIQSLRSEYQHIKANTDFTSVLREATSAHYNPTFKPPEVVHFWGSEEEDGKVPPLKAGYLYKKGSSKMRTVWNRRWFEILGAGSLRYVSEYKDDEHSTIDIRTCRTKETESLDRRHCMEIISPHKSLVLQADNEWELKDWIDALQVASTTPPGQPVVLPNAPKVALYRDSVTTGSPTSPYSDAPRNAKAIGDQKTASDETSAKFATDFAANASSSTVKVPLAALHDDANAWAKD